MEDVMKADTTQLSTEDVVNLVAAVVDPDERDRVGGPERSQAELQLGEWAASQPEPTGDVGPAPNC
jgi:hypothetical protein